MDKPQIGAAAGLAWRPRRNGWAAVWLARQDIAKKGFKPSTHQIGVFTKDLTETDLIFIKKECARLQDEMYEFGSNVPKVFGGTVRALINEYQTDPYSRYQKMRYKSRKQTDALLKRIDVKIGRRHLSTMGARDFIGLYDQFRFPEGPTGRELISTAHAAMTTARMLFSYGTTFELDGCAKLKGILSTLPFENTKARTEAMTLRQCENIIAMAHKMGLPSIALAQAAQFDLRARQKDIIGEWVPVSEPGISRIGAYHGHKWLRGLLWEELSSTMILTHPISKSRTGKILERDLKIYPMLMAELDRIPAEKRAGPIVVCDLTGRPWVQNHFRCKWREVATAAGVPKSVYNMDSRAGGITETIEATGGNIEAARKEAEHSNTQTTERYSRRKQESVKDSAAKVLDFRAKNTA